MLRDLRGDFARKQLRTGVAVIAAQNRNGGLVAGRFQSEDCHKQM
jgi:hypothetical protein